MTTCSFKNCLSYKGKDPNINFFCFPRANRERCLEWILRSGDETLMDILPPISAKRQRRVCSLHFSDSAFTNSTKLSLNWNSIPNYYNEGIKTVETASKNSKIITTEINKEASVPQHFETSFENNSYNVPNTNDKTPKENENNSYQVSNTNDKTPKENENNYFQVFTADDKAPRENRINSYTVFNMNDMTPKENDKHPDLDFVHRIQMRREVLDMKLKLQNLRNKYCNLQKQLKRKEKQIRRAKEVVPREKVLSEVGKYVEGVPSVFVNMQFRTGNRAQWLPSEKELALSFYETSPQLYSKMLGMSFKLPTIKTVKLWMKLQNELCDFEQDTEVEEAVKDMELNLKGEEIAMLLSRKNSS